MPRHLVLFIAIAFLTVQMMSIMHMSEHAFEKHEHNGQTCDIYLHCKQSNSADTPKAIAIPVIKDIEPQVQSLISALYKKEIFKGAIPRAPPTSLLSLA